MPTQEFYVRNPAETEARGPFNLEQLISLAEAGHVTFDTLCYDATTENWTTLGSNPELRTIVFPEKKKLTIKKDLKLSGMNKAPDSSAPITVDDMLAAAEGRTADTMGKSNPEIAMARAAKVGMWCAFLILLACAAGELLPSTDAIIAVDVSRMLVSPLIIFGLVDIFFAVLLALGTAAIYPLIRFRAMLGFGFLAFIFYIQGMPLQIFEAAVGLLGLYLCTVLVNLAGVLITALVGLLGTAALSYYFLSV